MGLAVERLEETLFLYVVVEGQVTLVLFPSRRLERSCSYHDIDLQTSGHHHGHCEHDLQGPWASECLLRASIRSLRWQVVDFVDIPGPLRLHSKVRSSKRLVNRVIMRTSNVFRSLCVSLNLFLG